MKPLFVFAAVLAVAVARPELYKEQEDFQYSRSSSDDGTKSGYYGAQRGNMGGNYERAHNMDSLAQNQMSGLVRQVEGELGDGAQQRTGSVYSSANSRGTYGSGHYDLSNLAGRNFQEGTSYGNSHSSSSLSSQSSSAHNSAAYSSSHSQSNRGSRYGGYQRSHDAQTQTDDLQSLDNAQSSNLYGYGRQASHSSGYQANAGFHEQSEYDRSNANSHADYGSNVRTRIINATPVRVVITPGGRVAIPIAAQTYNVAHGSSAYNQNALTNSETETIDGDNQAAVNRPEAKHYESSYSYHKQWEKHNTVPSTASVSTPTESTIPRNSELYEDNEAHRASNQYDARGANYHNAHLSSASGRVNNVKSASSQSRYHSNYHAQESGASNANSNAYTQTAYNARNHGASSDGSTYNAGSRYHGGSSAANLHAQTEYNAGAHTDLNSQVEDLNSRPKSYQSSYSYHKSWERQGDPYVIKPASPSGYYDGQASQRLTAANNNQRHATYHSGSHYNQDQLDCDCDENGFVRVARSVDKTEADDMVQSVNNFDGQELVQQAQNTWDFDQQENAGQQTQNLEDFGQQAQSAGQQFENKWDTLPDFGQQSQSDFDQQNVGQESQNHWDQLGDLEQQSAKNWGQTNLGQQSNNPITWEDLDIIKEQLNKKIESHDQQTQNFLGQQDQDFASQVANEEQTQKEDSLEDNKPDWQSQINNQNVESPWDKFDSSDTKLTKVMTEQTKLNVDHSTESNEFYWHQISNIGGMEQQVNSFDKETDYQNPNYDIKPLSHQYGENIQQNPSNVAFDNDNNKHYSYSSGFANPSLYNFPMTAYENTYQAGVGDYGIQRWGSQNSNSYSSTSWQTNNFQTNEQDSPLSSFWGKFDSIEKETLSSSKQNLTRDESHRIEKNNTDDSKVLPVSDVTSVTDNSDVRTESNITSPSQVRNMTPRPELQTSSQTDREPELSSSAPVGGTTGNKEAPERPADTSRGDISPQDFNDESERPEDVGRGDIGSQDFGSTTNAANEPYKSNDGVTQQNKDNKLSSSDLTVLSLEQQKTQDKDKILIVGANNTPNTSEDIQTQSHNKQKQQQNLPGLELQNVNPNQQYVNNFEQMTQQHDNIEQQNNYFQWQNVPNYEQGNVNVEQQNVNNFGQENVNLIPQTVNNNDQNPFQDVEQQNEKLEQQNFNNFDQQNMHDSQQQNLKIWDNLDQGLEHKTNTQEQQSISQMDDKYVTGQQNSLPNVQDGREPNPFEQLNQNMTNFDQENVKLLPQTINKTEENPFSDLVRQNENLEQQHFNNFEPQSVPDSQQQNLKIWDNLDRGFEHKTNTQEQQSTSQLDEKQVTQQQFTLPNIQNSEEKQNEFEQSRNFDEQNPFAQFEQQNTNFEQQNQFGQFEQQNQFGQFEQQNSNFDQQNQFAPFEQQNSNFEQNQFGQFEQQNANFEQQNPFGQFEQQNANFEQQNQFGQDLVGQHFGKSENLEQQNVHNFEQESIQHFGQQHEPLEHDTLQSSSQSQSMQDFELQKENIQQHNLNKFGQQQENAKNLRQDIPQETQDLQKHSLQEQKQTIEEPVVQKVYNTESNSQKTSENVETTPPVEPSTEKPGFWKSVGNKFSNAKNKVVSWFKSN